MGVIPPGEISGVTCSTGFENMPKAKRIHVNSYRKFKPSLATCLVTFCQLLNSPIAQQSHATSTVLRNHKRYLTGTKDKGLVRAIYNLYLGASFKQSKVYYSQCQCQWLFFSMSTELNLCASLISDHYSKHSGHANDQPFPI